MTFTAVNPPYPFCPQRTLGCAENSARKVPLPVPHARRHSGQGQEEGGGLREHDFSAAPHLKYNRGN